jgi:hypothetical protein
MSVRKYFLEFRLVHFLQSAQLTLNPACHSNTETRNVHLAEVQMNSSLYVAYLRNLDLPSLSFLFRAIACPDDRPK